MSNSKWPYLAALLDGEGTICLHERAPDGQSAFFLQVVIYNSSMNLMRWLVSNFGGKFYTRTKQETAKKIQYAWHPSGKKNRELLLLGVLPYLVVKREQAKLALANPNLLTKNFLSANSFIPFIDNIFFNPNGGFFPK